MPVYAVLNYDVTDEEAYAAYPPAAGPTIFSKPGAKVHAADYAPDFVEGSGHGVVVVLEFESRRSFEEWYESDEYQAVLPLRTENTAGGFFALVDSFVPPTQ